MYQLSFTDDLGKCCYLCTLTNCLFNRKKYAQSQCNASSLHMDTSLLICDGVDVLKIPRNHQRWSLVLVKLTAEGEK